jgi:hypothetical protein
MILQNSRKKIIPFCVLVPCLLMLVACTPAPPRNTQNICSIFKQYPRWYWAAEKTQAKWGVPISVQMAIIHQESSFDGKAKPDREKLLWIIPWKRPSSAYGYSQALKQTWENYQKNTGEHGKRNHFSAASDFIGWYSDQANKRAGIAKNNAYALYLAYHEGIGGYQQKTYTKKSWLMPVARKVSAQASIYQDQLNRCHNNLKKRWWHYIF